MLELSFSNVWISIFKDSVLCSSQDCTLLFSFRENVWAMLLAVLLLHVFRGNRRLKLYNNSIKRLVVLDDVSCSYCGEGPNSFLTWCYVLGLTVTPVFVCHVLNLFIRVQVILLPQLLQSETSCHTLSFQDYWKSAALVFNSFKRGRKKLSLPWLLFIDYNCIF